MEVSGVRQYVVPVAAGLLSFFLYQMNMVFFLFLLPIQFVWTLKGAVKDAFLPAGVLFTGIILQRMIQGTVGHMLPELVFLIILTGGLYSLNFVRIQNRKILSLISVSFLVMSVLLPFMINMMNEEPMVTQLSSLVREYIRILMESSDKIMVEENLIFMQNQFVSYIRILFLSCFGLIYVLMLVITWYLGNVLANRYKKSGVFQQNLEQFRMPEWYIWILFVPLTIVLLLAVLHNGGIGLGLSGFRYWLINICLIMAGIYSFQGISIILSRSKKGRNKFSAPGNLLFMLFIGLFIPGINMIVMIGLPALGLLENWVNLRKYEGVNTNENHPL